MVLRVAGLEAVHCTILALNALQRKFMVEEAEKAAENGMTYTYFKAYVNSKYPHGVQEADWDNILSEVSYFYIIRCNLTMLCITGKSWCTKRSKLLA